MRPAGRAVPCEDLDLILALFCVFLIVVLQSLLAPHSQEVRHSIARRAQPEFLREYPDEDPRILLGEDNKAE